MNRNIEQNYEKCKKGTKNEQANTNFALKMHKMYMNTIIRQYK